MFVTSMLTPGITGWASGHFPGREATGPDLGGSVVPPGLTSMHHTHGKQTPGWDGTPLSTRLPLGLDKGRIYQALCRLSQ